MDAVACVIGNELEAYQSRAELQTCVCVCVCASVRVCVLDITQLTLVRTNTQHLKLIDWFVK